MSFLLLRAVVMVELLHIAGVLAAGTAVAFTIGKGVTRPGVIRLHTVGAAMMSRVVWSPYTGFPPWRTRLLTFLVCMGSSYIFVLLLGIL